MFYLGLVGRGAHATQGATRGATNALLPELRGTLLRDLIVGVRYLGAASGSRHVGFADRVAKMKGVSFVLYFLSPSLSVGASNGAGARE